MKVLDLDRLERYRSAATVAQQLARLPGQSTTVNVAPDDLAALVDRYTDGLVDHVKLAIAGQCSCHEAGCLHDLIRAAAGDVVALREQLAHEHELNGYRKIVRQAERKITRDEHTAELQRESARVNEMGGVIAHLVGVLAEVHRATTIENARTFAELALANVEAWHAGAWKPGPGDDAADWKPGHHREDRT